MARRSFGKVQQLPSGRHRASFVGPDGARVFAPMTFDSARDADTWLATQRADVVRGTWRSPTLGRTTLRDYTLAWLATRTDLKPTSQDRYARTLDKHILPALGHVALRDLTPAMVRAWHTGMAAAGPGARSNAYVLLRNICGQAVREDELTTNPCQVRNGGTMHSPERKPPTLPQIHALADAITARFSALVLVGAYGGLRFSEATALLVSDVTIPDDGPPLLSISKGAHRIRGEWVILSPKSEAGRRTVALPAFMGPVLRTHIAEHCQPGPGGLLFTAASGVRLTSGTFKGHFKPARERVGLPGCRFHDLRHAAATLSVRHGATLRDTMRRLGHSSTRAAMIYQHAADESDVLIAEALDRAASAVLSSNVVTLRPRPETAPIPTTPAELAELLEQLAPPGPFQREWIATANGVWHEAGATPSRGYCGREIPTSLSPRYFTGDRPPGRVCRACAARRAAAG